LLLLTYDDGKKKEKEEEDLVYSYETLPAVEYFIRE